MLKEIKKDKKIKGYSVLMVFETQRCHNAPVLSNTSTNLIHSQSKYQPLYVTIDS